VKLNRCSPTVSPFVKAMRIPSPLLGRGKSGFVRIGNPKRPFVVLDFDEVTIVGEALHAIRGKCDGGVEGGVSSSSDDEGESAQKEVSELREGVREIGRLAVGGNDRSRGGKVAAWMWRFGRAAILRFRGVVVDFTVETTSEFFDWEFLGEPDMLAVTGDKSGGASDVLKFGAHLRFS